MRPIARRIANRRLLLLTAALLPAACAAPSPPPTAQDQVFQAKASYETLLVDAVKYRQRPLCRTVVTAPPRVGAPVVGKRGVKAPAVAKTATRTTVIATTKPPLRTSAIKEPVAVKPVLMPVPVLAAGVDPATCANPRTVDLMRNADNAAEAVLDNAETTVRDPASTPAQRNEAVLAAQNSVASFDHILTQYGVK